MPERFSNLSRRDFNKLVGLGLIGIAALPLEYALYKNFRGYILDNELSFLQDAKEVQKLPADLYGVNFNAPFLWKRKPQDIDNFVNMARQLNGDQGIAGSIHTVRVLPDTPDSPLEEKLGSINTRQIENLAGFVDYLPDDFQVILPVIDGYWIFRSDMANPMYPASDLKSPYLIDTSSEKQIFYSQLAFFLGDSQKKAYKQRVDAMIERFGNNKRVFLEIGNEIAAPNMFGSRSIHSDWYAEMYSHIRQSYKRALLTGLSDPDTVDFAAFNDIENLINTDHVYLPRVKKYPGKLPVIVEEIGVSSSMFGRDFEKADVFMKHLMMGCVDNGIENGVARISGIFIWHADSGHHDNLEFSSETYPKSYELLTNLSPELRNLAHIT